MDESAGTATGNAASPGNNSGHVKEATPAATEEASPATVADVLATVYVPAELVIEQLDEDLDYDSLAPYFIDATEEKKQVEIEAKRLIDVTLNPDTPLVLNECQRLGRGDLVGYTCLTILAKTLINVKVICRADNDGISLVHAPLGHTAQDFRELIRRVRNTSTGAEMNERLRLKKEPGSDDPVWASPGELAEDAGALLDLVTGYIARYATQVARGNSWRDQQLGALAKFTAKAKVLLQDVSGSAVTALRNADLALASFEATYGKGAADGARQEEDKEEDEGHAVYRRFAATLENVDGSEMSYARSALYRVNQQRARVGVMEALDYVLMSLLPGNLHPGFGVTEYEVCGVVMETGFQDFQTLLFQDRDFEYTSTSEAYQLNFAHPAFRMLDALISHLIKERNERPPRTTSIGRASALRTAESSGTKTILEWSFSESLAGKKKLVHENGTSATPAPPNSAARESMARPTGKRTLELVTMSEIMTVMVPLALASPVVSARYKRFLDMFYLTLDSSDVVRPFAEGPFNAFVRLYTNDFEAARKQRFPPDVLQLADAVNTGLFSRTSLLDANVGGTTASGSGDGALLPIREEARRRQRVSKLAEAHELMSSWIYTESAVVVPCGLYVWLVVISAAILVGGGLAIGLTIQDRLTGVDPFNITMYAWALAALLLLICKARLVEEWAWSDFLHRRVKCRSVSELHAVTGIHDQLIIAKLLHDEKDSILMTRGPFNAVFLSKSDAGFSIDVPVQNKTLLLSGLVMIKVETPLGHALVCLDVRRGTELKIIAHREVGTNKERLMCQSIEKLAQAASSNVPGGGPSPQLKFPLKSGTLEWRKVEGVYNVLEASFI